MFTLFCRSSAAPAFTSSETISVLPHLTANISGDSPLCVMTDMMCSGTTNCFIKYSVKEQHLSERLHPSMLIARTTVVMYVYVILCSSRVLHGMGHNSQLVFHDTLYTCQNYAHE